MGDSVSMLFPFPWPCGLVWPGCGRSAWATGVQEGVHFGSSLWDKVVEDPESIGVDGRSLASLAFNWLSVFGCPFWTFLLPRTWHGL